MLEAVAAIGDTLVAEYMHKATSQLRFIRPADKPKLEIKLPTLGTVAGLGGEWDGHELLFGFQSFTVAPTIYHIDLKAKEAVPLDLAAD